MVVETKFRVSRYAQDVPLSLGSPGVGGGSPIYLAGGRLPWQTGRVPGIGIGTPGTGGYGEEYPITDPNPGSCRSGFTRNYLGQCVPIQQLPECPTGFARDSQGNCVQIPVTPVPPTPGMSAQIVRIQLPRSFIQGRTVTIRTWFQNYRADAPLYGIKLNLPGISFTHETPPVPTQNVGQTVRIDSTFTVPNFAQIAIYPPPPIPGTVALVRYQQVQCVTTPCNPQAVETPDTENINLYTNAPVTPPTPTPVCPAGYTGTPPNCIPPPGPPPPLTCPAGYTGTYPNCIPPVVTPPPPPPPTPGPCGIAERNIMAAWKRVYEQMEANRVRACASGGNSTSCSVHTSIANTWRNKYNQLVVKCGGSPAPTPTPVPTPTPTVATITITPTTVPRRGNFVISGAGFAARELVNIEIRAGNKISRTAQIANSSGQIRKTVRAAKEAGVSTVTLRGRKSNKGATASVTVT